MILQPSLAPASSVRRLPMLCATRPICVTKLSGRLPQRQSVAGLKLKSSSAGYSQQAAVSCKHIAGVRSCWCSTIQQSELKLAAIYTCKPKCGVISVPLAVAVGLVLVEKITELLAFAIPQESVKIQLRARSQAMETATRQAPAHSGEAADTGPKQGPCVKEAVIVGGGIGGLLTAIALRHVGINAQVVLVTPYTRT